jgi:hypothetical protein
MALRAGELSHFGNDFSVLRAYPESEADASTGCEKEERLMKFWKVALAAVAIVAFAGMAGRLVMAQSDEETPSGEDRPNFVARLAENLGISEDELRSAVQTTQLELLDEAVANGRIDEERAAEIRERIESGEGLKFGFGFGHGPGLHRIHHGVDEVADFLGVEESVVLTGLKEGQSLGEIAAANGSSAEALIDHLVTQTEERVNAKVADGDITQERADEILANARERITNMVNREPGEFPRFRDRLPEDEASPETSPEGAGLFF